MPCFHPLRAYRSPNGGITFSPTAGYHDRPLNLPCRMCIGCRLKHSRDWAIRCVHEAALYSQNCFITLTYRPDDLPEGGGLVKDDLQRFLKRLRKNSGRRFRYYACGEYGDKTMRPHYHALLFGFDFPDKKPLHHNASGQTVFESPFLEQTWGHGLCSVGAMSFESAAYCARYVMKKNKNINGPDSHHPKYLQWDPDTGEVIRDLPVEFSTMSRGSGKDDPDPRFRAGLGRHWLEKFHKDVFPDDFIIHQGRKVGVPQAYTAWMELHHPDVLKDVKRKRVLSIRANAENNTKDRLRVREEVTMARLQLLKRGMTDDETYSD